MPDTGSPYNLRYPALADTPNVPRDIENLADDVHAELTTIDAAQTALESDVTALVAATLLFERKPSDETLNNVATLQDDDDLFVAVEANSIYTVELILLYVSNNNPGDLKFAWSMPAGATFHGVVASGVQPSGSAEGGEATVRYLQDVTEVDVGGLGTTTALGVTVHGNLVVGGTAGTFRLRWSQNTAHASNTRVLDGSHLCLRKVG
jgi:hypothetical protein